MEYLTLMEKLVITYGAVMCIAVVILYLWDLISSEKIKCRKSCCKESCRDEHEDNLGI